jgi:hypothetical protein
LRRFHLALVCPSLNQDREVFRGSIKFYSDAGSELEPPRRESNAQLGSQQSHHQRLGLALLAAVARWCPEVGSQWASGVVDHRATVPGTEVRSLRSLFFRGMSEGEPKQISVTCNLCGEVEAAVIGSHFLAPDDNIAFEPQGTVLAACPKCNQPLVAQHWWSESGWIPATGEMVGEWSPFRRVWPDPDPTIPHELPEVVGDSLREAQKCLRAGAYIAWAAMCGRALEGLCRDLNADDQMLAAGLKQLRDQGKIDERLYEWGEELHAKRNIAAHPDLSAIYQRDAQYIFDFTLAICDYVYVLTAKFDRFKSGT